MSATRAKLLLVDDMPANLHTLSRALASDYDLSVATSGARALALAETLLPDLILLDIMMPEMDGLEVLRRLRHSSWGTELPVILVTADDRTETQVKGLDLGADDFIAKPVVVPVVLARIRTQLERKHLRDRLQHLALYDGLTDLPNRVLLADRMRQAMAQALRRNLRVAVVFLDLDGFKAVNDTHGHAVGDSLLLTLSRRLQEVLREGDVLARLGGDEFVAILIDIPELAACETVLQRMLETVARPVIDEARTLHVSASLGVSFFPQEQPIEAEQLLRQADQAMYQAKLKGKNRYCFAPLPSGEAFTLAQHNLA